jgi:hypothetical protein
MSLRWFVRKYCSQMAGIALLLALSWLVPNRIVAVVARVLMIVYAVLHFMQYYKEEKFLKARADQYARETHERLQRARAAASTLPCRLQTKAAPGRFYSAEHLKQH